MYKNSTIEKINALEPEQKMRLGRCTIKCKTDDPETVIKKLLFKTIDICDNCIFSDKRDICVKIECLNKIYIKA